MEILKGTEYAISENFRSNFFLAESLTIVSIGDKTLQFILNNGKGYGAMPLQHFTYLRKRNELTEVISNREMIEEMNEQESQEKIS